MIEHEEVVSFVNTCKITDMSGLFKDNYTFNQPIGDWDVSKVTTTNYMFKGVTLSSDNYDDILNKWNSLSPRKSINFHGGESKYSPEGKEARDRLINRFLWTITDGGEE